MKKLYAVLPIMIFLVNCNSSHSQEEKKVEKSFEGISVIDLNTGAGDGEIQKGQGDRVEVIVTYTYDDESYTPKMEKSGNRLILEEKFHSRNTSGRSHWLLVVPDGLKIKFNTGSGDLRLAGITGELDFNSGSGDAHLEDFEGDLKLNSGSGDFHFRNVKGELQVNSGSGDHHIHDCDMFVKGNTGSGDIDVNQSKGGYRLNTGSGDVEAGGIVLSEEGKFNSGSGDVEIKLASALINDISANSGSGNAVVDFSGNAIEGEVIMTCKKRGGNIKAPFAFDKEEEIDRDGETYIQKSARLGSKDIRIEVGTGTGTAEIRK